MAHEGCGSAAVRVRRRRGAARRERRNVRRSGRDRRGATRPVAYSCRLRRAAPLFGPTLGMTAPRVSIVMPAFNEAEFLTTSVKSVVDGMRARGAPFDVLIVENGSPPPTLSIARHIRTEL